MPTSQHQLIYLGRFSDADTDETSNVVENSSVYLQTFGSAGDPLRNHVTTASFIDDDANGNIATDNVSGHTDRISYDVGFGVETHALDSLAVVDVAVRSVDGSVVNYSNVVVFQTAQGDLFLTNSDFLGTDIETGKGGIESVTITSIDSNWNGLLQNNMQDFVCFAAGTLIRTAAGEKPVQSLTKGDLIWTLDNGFQPLVWVGQRTVTPRPEARPVRISVDAIGPGMPAQDLVVSPNHRVMVRSQIARRMFADPEVFVPAKVLSGFTGVQTICDDQNVTYVHLLLNRHEVIWANGLLCESLLLGHQALRQLYARDKIEVLMTMRLSNHRLARQTPSNKRCGSLLKRHALNRKVLFEQGLNAGLPFDTGAMAQKTILTG